MAWNPSVNVWQYARWVWLIARNMRITEPTGAELAAVRTFLKAVWNPQTRTGTRPWLDGMYKKKAIASVTADYSCDIDQEPTNVLVEILGGVGRNLDGIPITTAEIVLVDALITATGNRRYGTGPLFGGVGGSRLP
jgi:hypothetical protein